jgi:hypothetical protein
VPLVGETLDKWSRRPTMREKLALSPSWLKLAEIAAAEWSRN